MFTLFQTLYSKLYGFEYHKISDGDYTPGPGDILLRSGHMCIYAGNGRLLDCGDPSAINQLTIPGSYYSFTYAIRVPQK